jgi:hypothetical protein
MLCCDGQAMAIRERIFVVGAMLGETQPETFTGVSFAHHQLGVKASFIKNVALKQILILRM